MNQDTCHVYRCIQQSSLLPCREDISICRTSENKKCRLGEGGFGVVYKALMNGVDEVAVKLVKADKPTNKELTLFHKEVRCCTYCVCTPTLHPRLAIPTCISTLHPSLAFPPCLQASHLSKGLHMHELSRLVHLHSMPGHKCTAVACLCICQVAQANMRYQVWHVHDLLWTER